MIADIKGSEHPEQVIVVSGHLDSWDLGTGAIDDGAGVAVSMEMANLIQKLHLEPKRTIRVVAWINEENDQADRSNMQKITRQRSEHCAAMETDGGAGHPIGVNIKGNPEVKKMLAPVAAICRIRTRACLTWSTTAALTSRRWKKWACQLLARSKTVVSISTITTQRPTHWTKLCRNNWPKIQLWSRSSRTRLRTWKDLASLTCSRGALSRLRASRNRM